MNTLVPKNKANCPEKPMGNQECDLPVMLTSYQGDVFHISTALARAACCDRTPEVGIRVEHILALGEVAYSTLEIIRMAERTGAWSGEAPLAGGDRCIVPVKVERLKPVAGMQGALYRWTVGLHQGAASESERDLQSRLETMGLFTGGIAHDFNNIITGVLGYADLASSVTDDQEIEDYLCAVRSAGLRARDLVAQILRLYRPGTECSRAFAVEKAVLETARLLRPSLPQDVVMEVSVAPDCPSIAGNPTQLYQVLTNLCTNACLAMENTGGTLRIALDHFTKPAPNGDSEVSVRLSVQDSGCGIPDDITKRIFEPGFTTRGEGKGTGLGLSNVKRIVAEHKGEISVSTCPGKGTTFTLIFPAIETRDEGEVDSSRIPAPPGAGRHILLVDGDAAVREIVCQTLAQIEFDVTVLASAREVTAAMAMNPERFDMLIADSALPDGSGLGLIQSIRSRHPEIRTVLCLSQEESSLKNASAEAGVHALLYKPFTREELGESVALALA